MKIGVDGYAPRTIGAHSYKADRAALIGIFAAGIIAGALVTRWYMRRAQAGQR
jgi:hypothetical protein